MYAYGTQSSVLYRPRSEGWNLATPWVNWNQRATIYVFFWLTLPRGALSMYWCCPSRQCVVFHNNTWQNSLGLGLRFLCYFLCYCRELYHTIVNRLAHKAVQWQHQKYTANTRYTQTHAKHILTHTYLLTYLNTNNKYSQQQCHHHDSQMSYPTTETTTKSNSAITTRHIIVISYNMLLSTFNNIK